ncbi:MAG TPA: ATP-binding protein [Candidatus Angelobacter sp.]|jgi:PAS domain S-box-containing protein
MAPEEAQIPSAHPRIRRIGLVACYVLIGAQLAVFAGWQFRIPILRGQVFGSFVSPNAALCFLVCALSILLQSSTSKPSVSRLLIRIGQALGLAVAIFGTLILVEHLTGIDLGIDRIFFAHRLDDWFLPNPGRFAITSAIAFLVGGVGLFFLRYRGRIPFADLTGSLALGVSYIGIIGYLFSFRIFYGRVMSAPTALLFAVLGIAMLCTSSTGWVVGALSSPRLGGLLVRRLTTSIIFLVPILAAIETWLENRQIVNPEGGMAILVLVVVAVFITLVLRTAAVMNSIDQAQEAAQQRATALSEELSALIEASPVGIIRFRHDRTVSSWSAAAERMLGWKAEEIIGKQLPIAPNSSHGWSELVAELAAGASLVHIETKQVRKDGTVIDALVSGAPIRSASLHKASTQSASIQGSTGQAQEFIGVIADSTELKRAKEALIRTEKLSAAGRLAASIAHEINNPLEAVTNLLYLARSAPERTQDFLAMAEEELARVTHLTKQTLGFYRDSGSSELIDLSALIEGVLNIYQSKLKGKQITVVKRLAVKERITTAAGEVRQVLSNLLANAVDASHDHGTIAIRTRFAIVQGSVAGVRITVADTGSGIDPGLRGKIWEPFFTTKKDVGTGLGLWVSRQIIEKHAGSIRFRSSAKGTVFVLFLPSTRVEQLRGVSARWKT